jgi:hypothetical protein|tara:strand:+ start:7699 stop:8082 length:384 start_codon:yes stop_codon:yes gene_type:complete
MGITINRKSKGRVKLTKPITKILNGWVSDLDSIALVASGQLKTDMLHERDCLKKILASNKLHIIDVANLNVIVEENINKLPSTQSFLNELETIFNSQNIDFASNALTNEAKIVKKFINKHFTFSFHP